MAAADVSSLNARNTPPIDRDTPPPRIRLAILVSHPIQYFAPVYRALAARTDIDLTVVFHCRAGAENAFDAGFGQAVKWDIPLLDGYKHRFLSSSHRAGRLRLSVIATLMALRPDVLIIHGYSDPTSLLALAVCKLLGINTLLRGDTRPLARHKSQSRFIQCIKGTVLRTYDGCLTIGSLNRDYYLANGVPSHRLIHAPFCVNNSLFAHMAGGSNSVRQRKRQALGISEREVVVLFASKLIPRKRATDLLAAFASLVLRCPTAVLLIAGSGEEGPVLRHKARSAGLSEKVKFTGFVNQSELPALYAASDIFVLPSEDEPWGLVVNEVMAAGLPVIVSNDVGAAADLVHGQNTGIIFSVGDVAALTEALRLLVENSELRVSMGKRASALIARWDVNSCASAIAHAAKILELRGIAPNGS